MVHGLDCKLVPSPYFTLVHIYKANERNSGTVDGSPNELDRIPCI